MKALALNFIRQSHLRFAQRDLPSRLAIYFHELEKAQIPAFTDAVSYFKDLGYRCVDARSYASSEAGEKLLFLSFDDNFKSWHESLDALTKVSASCTFYVNSGVFRDEASPGEISDYFDRIKYYGDRLTLARSELRDIADCGHTIGCHTHSHAQLSKTPRENWHAEILVSKNILEGISEQAIQDFSIPYGMRRHFSDDLRSYCNSIGFKTIVVGIPSQHHAEKVDPLQIYRTVWKFELSLKDNIANLQIDGRLYAKLFGRSAIG